MNQYIKTYCEQTNRQNFCTSGIAIANMLYGYSRKHRTIGCCSATVQFSSSTFSLAQFKCICLSFLAQFRSATDRLTDGITLPGASVVVRVTHTILAGFNRAIRCSRRQDERSQLRRNY